MTTTLIVLAHPDHRSFNGVWAEATRSACKDLGHTVLWSNLVAMNFNPVESANHYPHHGTSRIFDPLKAQEDAAETGRIPADVSPEIEKLRQADRVVFHFPLWWFAPPATLKGWFERVFSHGEMHSVEQRFDRGQFRGKKALFCVTTGSSDAESAFNGKEGDVQMLLWPAAYTLRYLGFSVLVPEVVHGVHGYHRGDRLNKLMQRLRGVLDTHQYRIAGFDERPCMKFNSDDDFDADGILKPSCPSHTRFIRHDR